MEPDRKIIEDYNMFMDGFERSYFSQEWAMQDGIYQQYSEYDNSCVCIAGTNASTILANN